MAIPRAPYQSSVIYIYKSYNSSHVQNDTFITLYHLPGQGGTHGGRGERRVFQERLLGSHAPPGTGSRKPFFEPHCYLVPLSDGSESLLKFQRSESFGKFPEKSLYSNITQPTYDSDSKIQVN